MKRALVPHPSTPAHGVRVGSKMTLVGSDVLKIEYLVSGNISTIAMSDVAPPRRADELWRNTCFEAFLGTDRAYFELNFAPSRSYAVYRFERYREGMQPALDLPAPDVYVDGDGVSRFSLDAWIDMRGLGSVVDLGLSAVLETKDGTKSYWALAHAPGPPDFHNRDTFIATLPPLPR